MIMINHKLDCRALSILSILIIFILHSKKIFIKWNFIINFFSSISFCQIQYMYKLLSAHIRWLLCCSLYTCRFAIKLGFIKNVFAFCEQWALHACIVNIANIVLGPTEFIISQVLTITLNWTYFETHRLSL